jgi:hypothetical protein
MVPLGSRAQREVEDYALTRYACYLIAQNGDPTKEPIAFAQTYFAVQTRKQELTSCQDHSRPSCHGGDLIVAGVSRRLSAQRRPVARR